METFHLLPSHLLPRLRRAPMISPATLAHLAMLRRDYRRGPLCPAPTKRPVGGRPNPCAAAPARPARETETRPHDSRHWRGRRRLSPSAADRLTEAVARGDIPVGVPLTGRQVRAASGVAQNIAPLIDTLAVRRLPIRLVNLAPGANGRNVRYRIDLR